MNNLVLISFLIVAGPIIGSLIGIIKKPSRRYLCGALGFAAGIMIAISFLELMPHALEISPIFIVIAGFVGGILLMLALDKLLPHIHPQLARKERPSIRRTAVVLAIGIALHNLPEGLAISSGFSYVQKLGIILAIGIAIHNIPEAIATVVPLYAATKKRLSSFLVSSSECVPELIGFLIGFLILKNLSSSILGLVMALTAGVMFYIVGDELIPTSQTLVTGHTASIGLALGVIVVLLLGLL